MKNAHDLFTKVDKQVSALKERIAQQREVIKRAKLRGHSTAAAETIQRTLHRSQRIRSDDPASVLLLQGVTGAEGSARAFSVADVALLPR